MHGHEAWTKSLDAGEVLVAGRLIDLALASEFGFQRFDADAIRGPGAIATTLANKLVDEGALRRIRHKAALAPPPLFRRAGLIVDHDRHAADFAQFLLDRIEIAAMLDARARGKVGDLML